MGRQMGGILGPVRGKVSNVVGAQWKETPYFRAYTIPANPQTVAQTAQRDKMESVVWVARANLGSVINPYWDPFEKGMSGYNRFTSINLKAMTDKDAYDEMLMTRGKLEKTGSAAGCTYATATGIVVWDWTPGIMGNGEDTDKAMCIALDVANKVAWASIGASTRVDESDNTNIGAGRTLADIRCYVGFYRGSGSTLMVADSVYDEPAAG